MMGFTITCGDLLPYFVAVETPLTVANIVDAKIKQHIINTVAKIIQLFPIAYFVVVEVYEKVEKTILWFGLPPFPGYDSKTELLEWKKIRDSMFLRRAPYAQFWGNVVAYSAGAFILAIPLLFKLSQVTAKRFHWEKTSKLLDASEKTIMTIVKVANIGFLVFALVAACAEFYPLGIAMCGLLLAVNLWSTVSYHWKPLPHTSGNNL